MDQPIFTVLGASGFIGAALVDWLRSHGHTVHAVTRASLPALLAARRSAGHVIDCIGLTGNFRSRPLETAEAHVGLVAQCLAQLQFASFLLLSSTRVYSRAESTEEDAPLAALPADPSDLYNVTKLAGEALCLTDCRSHVRVVRLSNVYGIGMPEATFLGQVLRDGRRTGRVLFHQSSASAKDYVSIATVAPLLPAVAIGGRHRLYNLAAGRNTCHSAIANCLRELTGWQMGFTFDAPTVHYPLIDIRRLSEEFAPMASDLLADLPALLAFAQEPSCSPLTKPMAA